MTPPGTPTLAETERVLAVDAIRLRRGARDVLAGVTFAVGAGELVAVMGLSGAGKTTVLRAIAGLEAVDGGSIDIAAADDGTGRRARPGRPGMVFQFHALFEHLTATENVALAPVYVLRRPRPAAHRDAARLLEELGVGHRARALPRELSGGEAQRVAIARALAMDPRLLLLDEPTASLDPARRTALGETLRRLAAGGRALVVTSHDAAFVRAHATRVLVLADGRIVEAGAPADVLDRPSHAATQALLQMPRSLQ